MNNGEAIDLISDIMFAVGGAKYPELWRFVKPLSELSDYIVEATKLNDDVGNGYNYCPYCGYDMMSTNIKPIQPEVQYLKPGDKVVSGDNSNKNEEC